MTVELDDGEARAIACVLGALIRDAAVAGRPTPHSMRELWRRLDHAVEVSQRGQAPGGDPASSFIGTHLAAEILGWGERRVRRYAADLDGRLVGDRLLYPETSVREYAKAMQENRIRE